MGRLVMSFRGICIHLHHDKVQLPDGVMHRVVAVNAELGAQTLFFGNPPPHFSVLVAEQQVESSLRENGVRTVEDLRLLSGVHLSVVNSIGDPTAQFIHDVPKLTHYKEDTQLRPDIFSDLDVPTRADCYIDMKHGTVLSGRFAEGGVYTTWIVETDGDPQLRFAWNEGEQLVVSTPTVPSTPDGMMLDHVPGSIVVVNSTIDGQDKQNDFVLHYLARVGGIPVFFDRPFPDEQPVDPIGGFFAMTSSCSNSQYP